VVIVKVQAIKEVVVAIVAKDKVVDTSQIGGMINLAFNAITVISLVIMPLNVTIRKRRNLAFNAITVTSLVIIPLNVTIRKKRRELIMLTTKRNKMMGSY